MSALVKNILDYCHSLKQALADYGTLPEKEQKQVWKDLTGTDAKGRVFIRGKEPATFASEFEPRSLVEESLVKLDLELVRMNFEKKRAYCKALKTSPDYVQSRDFRLKFLRAEKFDVGLAAARLALHFEEKLQLFGEELLGREILLSDLDENDLDSLRTGYLQVLPERDGSNRKVLFYYKAVSECYKERENLLRSFWYVANVISQSEDVQKLGIVNLVYNIGGYIKGGMDYEKSRRVARLFRAVPLRFNSFFVCLDEGAWMPVVDAFSFMISKYLRIRMRIILGSHDTAQDTLKAVGFPVKALPIDKEKNDIVKEAHLKWIEEMREIEDKKHTPPGLDSELLPAECLHILKEQKTSADDSRLISTSNSFLQAVG